MTFVWMSRLPSTRMFLLERHDGDAGLGEGVEDGHDLDPATMATVCKSIAR